MKSTIIKTIFIAAFGTLSFAGFSQSILPGKETIDKKEVLGLTLNQSIPDKHLSTYWEAYLDRFGKVKGKRGSYTIAKASVPTVSGGPVQLSSVVSSVNKTQSKVFLALYADDAYVTSSSDKGYQAAEALLKDFSDYAGLRENVRIADETFTAAEKGYQKLQKDNEDIAKEISKTEKKLNELRSDLEKGKAESQTSLLDLQNKQKALETAKSKVPGLK